MYTTVCVKKAHPNFFVAPNTSLTGVSSVNGIKCLCRHVAQCASCIGQRVWCLAQYSFSSRVNMPLKGDTAKVHWPPKFARKLHGYILY